MFFLYYLIYLYEYKFKNMFSLLVSFSINILSCILNVVCSKTFFLINNKLIFSQIDKYIFILYNYIFIYLQYITFNVTCIIKLNNVFSSYTKTSL